MKKTSIALFALLLTLGSVVADSCLIVTFAPSATEDQKNAIKKSAWIRMNEETRPADYTTLTEEEVQTLVWRHYVATIHIDEARAAAEDESNLTQF
tara:strand:- start:49 stop:336 length:288 start_codon:yes stop_codon:yes gene_type:complete